MTMVLREIPAASAIESFVSAIDAIGDRTAVATWVAHAARGAFYALAPPAVDGGRLVGVTRGGLLAAVETAASEQESGDVLAAGPPACEALARAVLEHLRRDRAGWLMIHKPYLDADEPRFRLVRERMLGGERFHLLATEGLCVASLADCVRRFTLSWHFLMMAGHGATPPLLPSELPGTLTLLAVGAYDGESYLLWLRDRLAPDC